RSATIHSGRDERWGAWGAMSGSPSFRARDRGAPRFTRGATNVGGRGGPCRGPHPSERETEERHDSLGARRTLGGVGGHVGTPILLSARPRSATIHSGRDERWGVWGAMSGPPYFGARDRGAPRFTRGATNVGGCGGPCRGPHTSERETEERHDSLGARRTLGVWGAMSGPPYF